MSMRVVVEDKANGIVIFEQASDGYSPDVMDDLNARALSAYKDILTFQIGLGEAVEATEGETK